MRILLVEDDKEMADFLGTHLKEESFVVDVAGDGEYGSYLGRTNDYALVLLDIKLPKKNGLDVLKEIRFHGKMMPIIILSATTESETKVDFLNAGVDDYLVKPFSFLELLARIGALLRRPSVIMDEIFFVDNLILSVKKHVVKRGEREIHLTQKEFMLLAYLMENKGFALSRSMILGRVWDMDTDPFSNTIESHILNLRKKINFKGENKLISTISKTGYKIA